MAKGKKSKPAPNGHEPFDSTALMGEGEDFDITPALFEESEEEKEIRRRFYDTTPAKSDQAGVDSYIHTIAVSGSFRLQDRLQNRARVAIQITDADGQVIASKAVNDYRPDRDSGFRNFAKLCIRRQVITAVKTATRQKHGVLNGAVSWESPVCQDQSRTESAVRLGDTVSGHSLDPAESVVQRERLQVAAQGVASLSQIERTAVVGIAEGYSYEEIMARSGVSFKQIDNAAQRGKRKVLQALEAAA